MKNTLMLLMFLALFILLGAIIAGGVISADPSSQAWKCPIDGKRVFTGQDYTRCNRCPATACFRHTGQKCQQCNFGRYRRVNVTLALDETAEFNRVDEALARHRATWQPLVIVIGGEKCSWCVKQKQALKAYEGDEFFWIYVDHSEVPQYKVKGGIPQLAVFKAGKHQTSVGYKPIKDILKLVK